MLFFFFRKWCHTWLCLCVSVLLCVFMCAICLWSSSGWCSLMARAVPGSRVVTASWLTAWADWLLPKAYSHPNPCAHHTPAHIPTPPPPLHTQNPASKVKKKNYKIKNNTFTNKHHYVSCCLDSSKCVYVAMDGCLKSSLRIDVSAG